MDDDAEVIRAAMRLLAQRARRPTARICAVCGREYQGAGRSRYCGRTCRTRAYRARRQPPAPEEG